MKWLKSRTIWTLAFMVAFNVLQAAQPMVSTELYVLINALLTALAGYFRINVAVK